MYSKSIKYLFQCFILLVFTYLTYLMIRICIGYFPWQDDTNFLALKQDVIEIAHWKLAFQIHVITSSFVLLAGFTQFFKLFRQHYPRIHRYMGWLYIVATLGFALPSGFVMAFYANGGVSTQLCFFLLSIFWGASTVFALRYALQHRWDKHRDWMIRSFALAASALSLRTWKIILYQFQPYWDWLTPTHIYQLESWLGVVVNMIVAEILIYYLYYRRSINKAVK